MSYPWEKGEYNRYKYVGEIYREPSGFGINEGRISKLWVKDEKDNLVVNYDRGWDIIPTTEDEFEVIDYLLHKYR